MRTLTLWQWELVPWYVFCAYWVVSSLRSKRTKTAEKTTDRIGTISVMVLAYLLLFSDVLRIGPLRLRFLPARPWLSGVGIFLTSFGVAVAIWARYRLGEYWSARVTLKEDHRIIRTGPYAFVRHPIYTGMLVAAVGTAAVVGEWRGVVAVFLVFFTHSLKAKREESLLMTEFGAEYMEYRRGTGFLFPGI
jgi:protein-S-isoprenylcysteine O-methyltransferase Ste14